MPKIPLLSTALSHKETYITSMGLPKNYMEDFSLMAFVVDHFEKARSVIVADGYMVKNIHGAAQIHMDRSEDLLIIRELLEKNKINCELADIADTLYQA